MKLYLMTLILSQFSCFSLTLTYYSVHAMISLPLRLFFINSLFICMQRAFQSSFLQALSNQLLCIICLKETGSMPSAWCYHAADTAGLALPPLLWHDSASVELKAASQPFRSPIIDQEWQRTAYGTKCSLCLYSTTKTKNLQKWSQNISDMKSTVCLVDILMFQALLKW